MSHWCLDHPVPAHRPEPSNYPTYPHTGIQQETNTKSTANHILGLKYHFTVLMAAQTSARCVSKSFFVKWESAPCLDELAVCWDRDCGRRLSPLTGNIRLAVVLLCSAASPWNWNLRQRNEKSKPVWGLEDYFVSLREHVLLRNIFLPPFIRTVAGIWSTYAGAIKRSRRKAVFKLRVRICFFSFFLLL